MFITKRSISTRGIENVASKLKPKLLEQTSRTNKKTGLSTLGVKIHSFYITELIVKPSES